MESSRKVAAPAGRRPRPTEVGEVEGVEFCARYQSARVGGDFFDAVVAGDRLAFLLSDIAGRREQAHPIAAQAQEAFRRAAMACFSAPDANLMEGTSQLVQAINQTLVSTARGVHFAPTFLGCYDWELGLLAYINAGGQPTAFRDTEGVRPLPNVAMPMGLFTHLTYEPAMQAFEPGARLLVVTKGVTESVHGRSQFGERGVAEVLERAGTDSAEGICRATLDAAGGVAQKPWWRSLRCWRWFAPRRRRAGTVRGMTRGSGSLRAMPQLLTRGRSPRPGRESALTGQALLRSGAAGYTWRSGPCGTRSPS